MSKSPSSSTAGYLTPGLWGDIGQLKKHDQILIDKAKHRARSDLSLSDWLKQGHYYNPQSTVEPKPLGYIPRVHARDLTVKEFVKQYEEPNLPVLIDGIADSWPAMQGAWTPANLYTYYRHRRFRCGEDDDGYPVKMKLKYFLRYMKDCHDDSPMYIFDSMYDNNRSACGIMYDYAVPHYFGEDLFRMVGEHRRPPYRWMLVGPKRSGTCVHIDPLNTSAWNTLIYGRKRWVLFTPDLSRATVKGRDLIRKETGEDDEAVDYFTNLLPRIKERGGAEIQSKIIEFTQYPGETVFVPGGWWHAVMNIDDTIAVTQNFCSTTNFERVWLATREGRKGMARKWLKQLRIERPDLAAVADKLNVRDNWNGEELAAKHRQRKAAKLAKRQAKQQAKLARRQAREEAKRKQARKHKNSKNNDESDEESDSSTSSSSSSSSSSSNGSSSSGSVTSESSRSSGDNLRTASNTIPPGVGLGPHALSLQQKDSGMEADGEMSDTTGRRRSKGSLLPTFASSSSSSSAGTVSSSSTSSTSIQGTYKPIPTVPTSTRRPPPLNSDESSSSDGQNAARRKKRK